MPLQAVPQEYNKLNNKYTNQTCLQIHKQA